MREEFPIDESTAERLLAGLVAPDDALPGYRALARAFDDARRPLEEDELAGRANIVAAE